MDKKKVEELKAGSASDNDGPGTMAILSLISGSLSIISACVPVVGAFLGFIFSMAAIVLGIIELNRIKNGIAGSNGKGISIIGIILGALGILIGIFWIVVITIIWIAGTFGGLTNAYW